MSDSIFLGGNPPFQPTANVTFGNVDNPGGTSANSLPLTVTTQSKDFKNPEAWNWNLTVERQLPGKSVVTVAYVARRGLHLQREANINQPTPEVIAANPGVTIDALRPYKGYNSIRETDNVARSLYNSLQLSWNKRFSHGFTGGVSYTLSKSMDDGSAQRDIIPNTYNAANLWGQSDFDVRHIFIANYIYELPFFRDANRMSGKMLGGWQISGITQFQTGTPCGVAVGNDYAGVGQDGSFNCGGQFWVTNGDTEIVHDIALNGASDNKYWFKTTDSSGNLLWTQPAKGTFNNQAGSATSSTTPVSTTGTSVSSRSSPSPRRPASSSAPRRSTSSTTPTGAAPTSTRPTSPPSERSPARPATCATCSSRSSCTSSSRENRKEPKPRPGNRAGFLLVPGQTTRGSRCLRVTHSSLRKTLGPTWIMRGSREKSAEGVHGLPSRVV